MTLGNYVEITSDIDAIRTVARRNYLLSIRCHFAVYNFNVYLGKLEASNTIIIIGMDSNCSLKSTNRRQNSFKTFVNQFSLETILSGDTPTFHHNNGTSESQIDHIMTNKPEVVTFSMQICKIDKPANLSSHDAIIGSVKVPQTDNKIDEVDFSHTYEEFYPKKIIWEEENLEYQGMLSRILKDLMSTFDQPEHLPALAEMSSNMIIICAEKFLQSKQPKKPQKNDTPKFSRNLREAHEYHNKICKEWRKAGRPTSGEHPAKLAKKEIQRNLQRIVRNEETDKAKIQHEDLMETNANNIGLTCQKLKKIRGENIKEKEIPEIETHLGTYKGNNVLEGFRANTEYVCNDTSNDKFSDEFLKQCETDLMIIADIAESESVLIPPMTSLSLKQIIFKKLKLKKACDLYMLTVEHLRFAGDGNLQIHSKSELFICS